MGFKLPGLSKGSNFGIDKSKTSQATNQTDNSNRAIGGDGSMYLVDEGASLEITDGGLGALAFDFANRVNASAMGSLDGLTRGILEKTTTDSGERVQKTVLVIAAIGGLVWLVKAYKG